MIKIANEKRCFVRTTLLREENRRFSEGTTSTGCTCTDRTGVIRVTIEMSENVISRRMIDCMNQMWR